MVNVMTLVGWTVGHRVSWRLFWPVKDTKHCWSYVIVQGGDTHMTRALFGQQLVIGKPGLTQATLKQEKLPHQLSINVHPLAQVMWTQRSEVLGLLFELVFAGKVNSQIFRCHWLPCLISSESIFVEIDSDVCELCMGHLFTCYSSICFVCWFENKIINPTQDLNPLLQLTDWSRWVSCLSICPDRNNLTNSSAFQKWSEI